jgi:molecular chaperone GrpE
LREKDQFKKLAQRVQADFINYRNRTEEEITQARRSGVRRLALRVIEVLDLFDAALSPQATPAVDANWVNGVRAIQKSLLAALGSEGIERLTIAGEKFDPRRHEALISTPTAEHEPGTVIRELRPGYAHQGEVVRPAQVEVATSPPDDAPAPESKPE